MHGGAVWCGQLISARRYLEANLYNDLKPPTPANFASLLDRISLNRTDWSSAAKKLWDRNEWDKCRMLSELTEYFVVWKGQNFPDHSDREATTRLRLSGQLRNGLEFRPPNLMRESGMSCSHRAQRTRDGPAGSDSRRQQNTQRSWMRLSVCIVWPIQRKRPCMREFCRYRHSYLLS